MVDADQINDLAYTLMGFLVKAKKCIKGFVGELEDVGVIIKTNNATAEKFKAAMHYHSA